MRSRILIIGVIILSLTGTIFSQSSNCGILISRFEIYDSTSGRFVHAKLIPNKKIYYKDSIVIIPTVRSITNSVNGIETSYEEKNLYYTYINLRAKKIDGMSPYTTDSMYFSKYNATFYEYPAFSKDSFFTKKYFSLDTAILRTWAFFLDRVIKDEPKKIDSIISTVLSDTIINGVTFHRKKNLILDTSGNIRSIVIAFSRCDVKNWMRIFIKNINDQGCINTGSYWKTEQRQWSSQHYDFLSRKLTKEELEVFKAWERNEKKHPVNKK